MRRATIFKLALAWSEGILGSVALLLGVGAGLSGEPWPFAFALVGTGIALVLAGYSVGRGIRSWLLQPIVLGAIAWFITTPHH